MTPLSREEKRFMEADALLRASQSTNYLPYQKLFLGLLCDRLPPSVDLDPDGSDDCDICDFVEVTSPFPFMLIDEKINGRIGVLDRRDASIVLEGNPLFPVAFSIAMKCKRAVRMMAVDQRLRRKDQKFRREHQEFLMLMKIAGYTVDVDGDVHPTRTHAIDLIKIHQKIKSNSFDSLYAPWNK